MRSWRPALTLVALASVLAAGLSLSPAQADTAPVISAIDTSTPGHAKGTVTTDAPYGFVAIADGDTPLDGPGVPKEISGGVITFDKQTWGLSTEREYNIRAAVCTSTSLSSCTFVSSAFIPMDVAPQVTWPEDRFIGPNSYIWLSVADPMGNQTFELTAQGNSVWRREIQADTSIPVYPPDGQQTLVLSRCSTLGCRPTGDTAEFLVDREFEPELTSPEAGPYSGVHPDATTAPDVTLEFAVEGADSYDLDWHLVRPGKNAALPGAGGTLTDLIPDAEGHLVIGLDLTGVADGQIQFRGNFSYDSPRLGVVHAVVSTALPRVDRVKPLASKVGFSSHALFPARDGYLDTFRGDFQLDDNVEELHIEFVNPQGVTVNSRSYRGFLPTYWDFVWDGMDAHGERAAAGTYRVRVTVTDFAGNEAKQVLGSLSLSWKRLVHKTTVVTIRATKSIVDRWAGRCSSITPGGSRHWSGGLGLSSNSKCKSKTWQGSGAVIVHRIAFPKGWFGGSVGLEVYGGASKVRPGSQGFIELWGRKSKWVNGAALSSRVGWSGANWINGDRLTEDSGWLYWRTGVGYGNRYDIKRFTIRFEGSLLQ